MGGDVFIGIRKRNGEIYLAERWTNPTSWWFNNPALYEEDEKVLDEYINLAEEPRPQTEIHPSEYGVILYDALNGKLLSRQDYSGIGRALVSLNDVEMLELTLKLQERGAVDGLRAYPYSYNADGSKAESFWGPRVESGPIIATADKLPRFFEIVKGALEACERGYRWFANDLPAGENAMFEVPWKLPGIVVDDLEGVRGWDAWPDVLKWVAEQGWAYPIWTQERVAEKLRDLEL